MDSRILRWTDFLSILQETRRPDLIRDLSEILLTNLPLVKAGPNEFARLRDTYGWNVCQCLAAAAIKDTSAFAEAALNRLHELMGRFPTMVVGGLLTLPSTTANRNKVERLLQECLLMEPQLEPLLYHWAMKMPPIHTLTAASLLPMPSLATDAKACEVLFSLVTKPWSKKKFGSAPFSLVLEQARLLWLHKEWAVKFLEHFEKRLKLKDDWSVWHIAERCPSSAPRRNAALCAALLAALEPENCHLTFEGVFSALGNGYAAQDETVFAAVVKALKTGVETPRMASLGLSCLMGSAVDMPHFSAVLEAVLSVGNLRPMDDSVIENAVAALRPLTPERISLMQEHVKDKRLNPLNPRQHAFLYQIMNFSVPIDLMEWARVFTAVNWGNDREVHSTNLIRMLDRGNFSASELLSLAA